MGSTVSIVIAVIAVVVGFLVLKNITDSDSSSSSGGVPSQTAATVPTGDTTGIIDAGSTTSSIDTSVATTLPFNFDPAQQVIVANAAGIGGTAGRYSEALKTLGWTMGKPANATSTLAVSVVYYLPGGEAVAASVAQAMSGPDGTIAASAMPTPVPIQGGILPAGGTVLVMLGTDRAEKAIPAVAGATATTLPTAPVDPATSVPG
ncbi:MAG: LytR C-terminal domain-containing protein [Ilumatobacteraceae bacterium]